MSEFRADFLLGLITKEMVALAIQRWPNQVEGTGQSRSGALPLETHEIEQDILLLRASTSSPANWGITIPIWQTCDSVLQIAVSVIVQ